MDPKWVDVFPIEKKGDFPAGDLLVYQRVDFLSFWSLQPGSEALQIPIVGFIFQPQREIEPFLSSYGRPRPGGFLFEGMSF